jgi:glucoamylase
MLTPLVFVLALTAAATHTFLPSRRQSSLESFIESERAIALQGVLNNIGGLNSTWAEGALPGVVVASPSRVNPDYFFTWTRDSALTYVMIIDELLFGNSSLRQTIDDYVGAQAVLQTVTNPSGTLYPAGLGLGEPKFYTNLTRFDVSQARR